MLEKDDFHDIREEGRLMIVPLWILGCERNKETRRQSLQMTSFQYLKLTRPESTLVPVSPLSSLSLGLLSTRIASLKVSNVVDSLQWSTL